jgi:hypothetical protein
MWRKAKYGNKKIVLDGHKFDSIFESKVFLMLRIRERGGEISNLQPHPGSVFLSAARIVLRPDFSYEEEGQTIYAEAKGKQTAVYRIKRRLWLAYGTAPLFVYTGKPLSIKLEEVLMPKKMGCTLCGK